MPVSVSVLGLVYGCCVFVMCVGGISKLESWELSEIGKHCCEFDVKLWDLDTEVKLMFESTEHFGFAI